MGVQQIVAICICTSDDDLHMHLAKINRTIWHHTAGFAPLGAHPAGRGEYLSLCFLGVRCIWSGNSTNRKVSATRQGTRKRLFHKNLFSLCTRLCNRDRLKSEWIINIVKAESFEKILLTYLVSSVSSYIREPNFIVIIWCNKKCYYT